MLVVEDALDFISKRISALRDSRNVSARELSLSIGNDKNYINRVENKVVKPSIEGLVYVCDYFGITLAEFFDDGTQSPLDMKELIDTARGMSADSLKTVIDVMRKIKGGKE